MIDIRFLLVMFLSLQTLPAEEILSECLVFKMPRQSRFSSDSKNPVEALLVNGQWKVPVEGDGIVLNDTLTVSWEAKKAEPDGWFRGRDFSGSYAHFSVENDQPRSVLLEAAGHQMVYVNGEARIGNRYQAKDEFEDWEPKFNFSLIPIRLKTGHNDLLFRCSRGRLKVRLHEPESTVMLNVKDATLPDLRIGEEIETPGAVIVINTTSVPLENLVIDSENAFIKTTQLPLIQPLSVRKVPFTIAGSISGPKRMEKVTLQIKSGDTILDTDTITLRVVEPEETYKRTFISQIDGSVQYYAVNPARGGEGSSRAMLLSVHGANVEGLNQAGSYYPKTWINIVAPTNRRPYGYNWEDWGRLDALEVLKLAGEQLQPDPSRIYLSGHSMGGHGTWHLGAMYPDRFAAIGPSAGWISFWSYRSRDDEEEVTPMQEMLLRATSPSRTLKFIENYKQHGIYIIHGDEDESVRVDQARRMVEELTGVHHDFVYHEQPGAGHWWDVSDEEGTDCVDWAPLFDFFARHAIPGKQRLREIHFRTASPGVSAWNNWVCIAMQEKQYAFSDVNIRFDPGIRRFTGSTDNVTRLGLDLSVMEQGARFTVELDSQKLGPFDRDAAGETFWLVSRNGQWQQEHAWPAEMKGPHRYGSFKSAFQNHFLFVYGTQGNEQENNWAFEKARYDAETFWYQGNGAVDIVADTRFKPESFPDRSVILYGNAETNSAWSSLLKDCPVQVSGNAVNIGSHTITGDNLATLFIRPRKDSDRATVGVVAGTGISGMRLTTDLPYPYAGRAYPDIIIMDTTMLEGQESTVKAAGFFGPDWSVEKGEFVWQRE